MITAAICKEQMFDSYLNRSKSNPAFRFIFQGHGRTLLNASSPIFDDLASKKNLGHGRGGVWFFKKCFIKYDFLRLKIFFLSSLHVHS